MSQVSHRGCPVHALPDYRYHRSFVYFLRTHPLQLTFETRPSRSTTFDGLCSLPTGLPDCQRAYRVRRRVTDHDRPPRRPQPQPGLDAGSGGPAGRRRPPPVLRQTARRHREAGLAAVTREHYAGGHWLASFATYGSRSGAWAERNPILSVDRPRGRIPAGTVGAGAPCRPDAAQAPNTSATGTRKPATAVAAIVSSRSSTCSLA